MKIKIDHKRAAWLRKYTDKATEINPSSAGKICWDTAINAYNQGKNAEEAAILIIGMGRGTIDRRF